MRGRKWTSLILAGVLAAGVASAAQAQEAAEKVKAGAGKMEKTSKVVNPSVVLETSLGNITLDLYPAKAPKTVENFLSYVRDGFYNGLIFHRVIKGFMIQGGGFGSDLLQKQTKSPVENEAGNGLKNSRGTIAMARTNVVNSATSQFFINVVDNLSLDHKDETARGFGYCVFGQVTDGMDVVDKIRNVKTTTRGHYQDVPVEPVTIVRAYVVGEEKSKEKAPAAVGEAGKMKAEKEKLDAKK